MSFRHEVDERHGLDQVSGDAFDLTIRRLGCEVIGLTWHHPEHGDIPLLWRNAQVEAPESGWKNHATILFPIVGGLHDMSSRTTDGTAVAFKRGHGFARESEFELIQAAGDEESFVLRYRLEASDKTMLFYPWRFRLEILYRLSATGLEQAITVSNVDERPMPFQLGWHPGFNAPFLGGEKSACHLELPQGPAVRILNDERCFITGEKQVVDLTGDFDFTEEGLDRTYMFDLDGFVSFERRVVSLLDPDRRVGVRVHFGDYPQLGLWSDADAGFICIEPWQGMDDSVEQEPFDRKFGMVLLPALENDTRRARIEVVG